MPAKRKDKEGVHNTPVKTKRVRQEKTGDFSDDEDLSDIDDGGEIFNGIRIPAELPPIRSAEEISGPRMIITHIVANNFKSYYGEVYVGPFHKVQTYIFVCSILLSNIHFLFELLALCAFINNCCFTLL